MANPTNSSPYVSFISPVVFADVFKVDEATLPKVSSKEPIIGYRVWHLNRETHELISTYKKVPWPFRTKMQRGVKTGTEETDFGLGIHAAKTRNALIENTYLNHWDIMFQSVGLWSDYKADVAGEVYLWGEVKECPHGYLAEFAYPKKLWMPEKTDPLTVMQLEENYGVPVELSPDFGEHKPNAYDMIVGYMPTTYKFVTSGLPTRIGKSFSFFQYVDPYEPKKDENKP